MARCRSAILSDPKQVKYRGEKMLISNLQYSKVSNDTKSLILSLDARILDDYMYLGHGVAADSSPAADRRRRRGRHEEVHRRILQARRQQRQKEPGTRFN